MQYAVEISVTYGNIILQKGFLHFGRNDNVQILKQVQDDT
jgi:hypothetical protein